jgi:hypothetical protein
VLDGLGIYDFDLPKSTENRHCNNSRIDGFYSLFLLSPFKETQSEIPQELLLIFTIFLLALRFGGCNCITRVEKEIPFLAWPLPQLLDAAALYSRLWFSWVISVFCAIYLYSINCVLSVLQPLIVKYLNL